MKVINVCCDIDPIKESVSRDFSTLAFFCESIPTRPKKITLTPNLGILSRAILEITKINATNLFLIF
jgi:hypothetical protein